MDSKSLKVLEKSDATKTDIIVAPVALAEPVAPSGSVNTPIIFLPLKYIFKIDIYMVESLWIAHKKLRSIHSVDF